jgi:hypothetical protein
MEQPLRLRHGPLTLPRSYIEAMRNTHGPFAPFADAARKTPGWSCYEIDATHSPNITAPEALMTLLDRAIRNPPTATRGRPVPS